MLWNGENTRVIYCWNKKWNFSKGVRKGWYCSWGWMDASLAFKLITSYSQYLFWGNCRRNEWKEETTISLWLWKGWIPRTAIKWPLRGRNESEKSFDFVIVRGGRSQVRTMVRGTFNIKVEEHETYSLLRELEIMVMKSELTQFSQWSLEVNVQNVTFFRNWKKIVSVLRQSESFETLLLYCYCLGRKAFWSTTIPL